MKRLSIDILLILTLLAASCGREEEGGFETIDYVDSALADTSSLASKILSAYQPGNSDGVISVIGESAQSAVIAEVLLGCDIYDNIDGKYRTEGDGLPDFSGETIAPVFDHANEPYYGYFEATNEVFVREIAAKCAVYSVCSRCCSNPFDKGFSENKDKAKMIILASPLLSGYGYEDIQYLFSRAGKEIGLIAPVQSALENVLAGWNGTDDICVWASKEVVSTGVYGTAFQNRVIDPMTRKEARQARESGNFPEMICLSPAMTDSARTDVAAYLDALLDAGYNEPVAAVIVDDVSRYLQVEAMNAEIHRIRQSGEPEYEKYRRILAPGFRFVSPAMTMAEDCYAWLRQHNAFTHKIAYPVLDGFMTVPMTDNTFASLNEDGSFKEEYKFNRAAGSEVETVKIIPASHRYFRDGIPGNVDSITTLTKKSLFYVH